MSTPKSPHPASPESSPFPIFLPQTQTNTVNTNENPIDRRSMLKTTLAAAAGSVFSIGSSSSARANSPLIIDSQFKTALDGMLVPRWQDPCPIYQPCAPLSEGTIPAEYEGKDVGQVLHGVAPEYHTPPETFPHRLEPGREGQASSRRSFT
jgi:hypothetical protein